MAESARKYIKYEEDPQELVTVQAGVITGKDENGWDVTFYVLPPLLFWGALGAVAVFAAGITALIVSRGGG